MHGPGQTDSLQIHRIYQRLKPGTMQLSLLIQKDVRELLILLLHSLLFLMVPQPEQISHVLVQMTGQLPFQAYQAVAGTYEFTIDGGGAWQAAPVFSSLIPGTYNVMMRDAVNPTCILVLNGALLLTQPAVLNAVVTKTDVNCFGANNGSIVISAPTGGYGTYGYSINGGSTLAGIG